jgi:hypothetical protein
MSVRKEAEMPDANGHTPPAIQPRSPSGIDRSLEALGRNLGQLKKTVAAQESQLVAAENRAEKSVADALARVEKAADKLSQEVRDHVTRLEASDKRVEEACNQNNSTTRFIFGTIVGGSYLLAIGVLFFSSWGHREEFNNLKELITNRAKDVAEREERARAFVLDYEKRESQLKDDIASVEKRYTGFVEANARSHSIMTMLAEARHHLVSNNDPAKCVEVAEDSLGMLNEAIADAKDNPELTTAFTAMKPSILLLLCEGVMHLREFERLASVAKDTVALNCDCPDAT